MAQVSFHGMATISTPSFPPPIQAFGGRLQRESIFVSEWHLDPRVRGDDKLGVIVIPFRGDDDLYAVIPAQAGIHFSFPKGTWIPAFAGMTNLEIPSFQSTIKALEKPSRLRCSEIQRHARADRFEATARPS